MEKHTLQTAQRQLIHLLVMITTMVLFVSNIHGEDFKNTEKEYRKAAYRHEKSGQLIQALWEWEIVLGFSPGNKKVIKRIKQIETNLNKAAERRFNRGVAFYRKGALSSAKKEFLLTLRLDPNHNKAFYYLKNRMHEREYTAYKIKKRDTLALIAEKNYFDKNKAFLISHVNDLTKKSKLKPGNYLSIPDLEDRFMQNDSQEKSEDVGVVEAKVDLNTIIKEAEEDLKEKEYDTVLLAVKRVLKVDAQNKKAKNLRNATYFDMGTSLRNEKKFLDSLESFKKVSPDYKDIKNTIAALNKEIKQEADAHYNKGVNFYINEQLNEAIDEWEIAIELNPSHPKAAKDMEEAKKLIDELGELEKDDKK